MTTLMADFQKTAMPQWGYVKTYEDPQPGAGEIGWTMPEGLWKVLFVIYRDVKPRSVEIYGPNVSLEFRTEPVLSCLVGVLTELGALPNER